MIEISNKDFKKLMKKIKKLKAQKEQLLTVIAKQNNIIRKYNREFAK